MLESDAAGISGTERMTAGKFESKVDYAVGGSL
jgi:hypothetical protein